MGRRAACVGGLHPPYGSLVSGLWSLGSFFWFGAELGKPLPDIAGFRNPRRATHKKAGDRPLRQNHREIAAANFVVVPCFPSILEKLFGPLPREDVPHV